MGDCMAVGGIRPKLFERVALGRRGGAALE